MTWQEMAAYVIATVHAPENGSVRNMNFSSRCPYCKSVDFRSVGVRNAVEQAIRWLMLPFRCSLCGHHFFLFRWLAPAEDEAA